MVKKLYAVDLCYYTEENVPECDATIFIRSDKDLENMPKHLITENVFVQEAMEANDCEGIGNVFEISEEEYELYKDDEIVLIEI